MIEPLRPYAAPGVHKETLSYYPPSFAPTIDLALCGRAWSYWVRGGRKPIPPDFFQSVMLSNQSQEAHLFFVDDVIKWIKGL